LHTLPPDVRASSGLGWLDDASRALRASDAQKALESLRKGLESL
jgi:hypothetical protein